MRRRRVELEVAGLVARRLSNKAIAAELHISSRTAQNHVQHILTKLGVSNRTQVASWFAGTGAERRLVVCAGRGGMEPRLPAQ